MAAMLWRMLESWFLCLLVHPWMVAAQFGGFGGYTPPAPVCKAFQCPSGQQPVGREDVEIVSYGCNEAGLNVLSMKNFDPSNPYAGMNQLGKNLNKCCVERDICKQTCGMTAKECHDSYQKCQQKVCKGDQNCQLQAMVADFAGDPYDQETFDSPTLGKEKFDPLESKCRGYNKAQETVCQCLPKSQIKGANEKKLKAFYQKFNPEKLDDKGEIKEVEEVWKKWQGKEASMFMALASKYKDKAVKMKEKPKPAFNDPPKSKKNEPSSDSSESPLESEDSESEAFDEELKMLLEKKEAAKADEDFDQAEELKKKVEELKQQEIARLKNKKDAMLKEEKYLEAKALKARIAKLEL